jgi:hypothetical protein
MNGKYYRALDGVKLLVESFFNSNQMERHKPQEMGRNGTVWDRFLVGERPPPEK